eukprot:SM000323S12627  [mRNA]  locus=s323:772:2321:- [translate_table: standard]
MSGKEKAAAAAQSFPLDLAAGALLGGVAHTIVAPVERAKLVLQTQHSNVHALGQARHREYKGMLDVIIRVAREEGVRSLWRGNGSGVLRYYPSVALNFALKDFYKTLFTPSRGGEAGLPLPLWRVSAGNFGAGALAGSTALLFTYPLDIAHKRLAADTGQTRQFRGLTHFLATIYRKQGIAGLYQGFPASVHGIVVHRSVYFGGFDTAKELLLADGQRAPFWKRWLLAQVATTTAGLVAYPLDTVRHRMMMQSGLEAAQRMYQSTAHCWREIYALEGVRGFYRGALSNMARGTGAALILVLYDEVRRVLHHAMPRAALTDQVPMSPTTS